MSESIPSVVKDLADAASTQTRVANRYWLLLLTVAFLIVLPRAANNADLPYLGRIDPQHFAVVVLLMLSILTIAFCTAHAHLMRVQMLVYNLLEKERDGAPDSPQTDPRDFFDALRFPHVSRVAPLAQILRGRHQFFSDKPGCPQWLKNITAFYYLIFKTLALLAYLGLPVAALFLGIVQLLDLPDVARPRFWIGLTVWIFVTGASVALLQTLIAEVLHVRRALRAMTKPEVSP